MTYKASPIRRSRRGPAEIQQLKDLMIAALREIQPGTVRQLFYRLV